MSEVETLAHKETVLTKCPALTYKFGNTESDPVVCGADIRIILTIEEVGDDFGSWTNHYVDIECGHSLKSMRDSVRHLEFV